MFGGILIGPVFGCIFFDKILFRGKFLLRSGPENPHCHRGAFGRFLKAGGSEFQNGAGGQVQAAQCGSKANKVVL